MKHRSFRTRNSGAFVNRWGMMAFFLAAIVMSGPVVASGFSLGGTPVNFSGYINQGVNISTEGDDVATYDGVNQMLTQILLEAKYEPNQHLNFFISGKLNMDMAYAVHHNSNEWEEKGFRKSRPELQFIDSWDDVLTEAHVTWTPNYNWMIRAGKQIVQWGEMDFSGITNVINPSDYRRGITDIEYEALLMPITILKAIYFSTIENDWLMNLNFEFIWNPNLNFRHNEGVMESTVGKMGVWAPWLGFETAGLDESLNFDEPDRWSEGQEFGFKIGAEIYRAYCQIMGWYGIANDPVSTLWDFNAAGTRIIQEGYYARERMLGGSVSREIPLRISWLGGVEPLIRAEIAYFKDSEIAPGVEEDQLNWGVGIDWKVRIPWLNPTNMFWVEPEYQEYRILDIPGDDVVDNSIGVYVETKYFSSRITPSIYWQRSTKADWDLWIAGVSYVHTSNWKVNCVFTKWDGKEGVSDWYNHADNVSVTLSYQF